ncbi:MAG: signal peptidase I [Bacilli bacterium]|jgi:signal peptidase I|nr:signal peptidase I [Bacilli bacterium]
MEQEPKKKSLKREIIEFLIIIIVIFFTFNYVLMSVKVNGTSMLPTYQDGERGIMLRNMGFNKPNYGNTVVVFYHWDGEAELIVKRVIGLPGDEVKIKDNQIYVNNKAIKDTKRNPNTQMYDFPPLKLADDEYFVMGDNRNVSKDSRMIGPVKFSDIKAINGFMYWPINEIKLID